MNDVDNRVGTRVGIGISARGERRPMDGSGDSGCRGGRTASPPAGGDRWDRAWRSTSTDSHARGLGRCLWSTSWQAGCPRGVPVPVRGERLFDRQGRNLLDYLDPRRYTILPNTAGCFSAEDALRTARLGRELLEGLGNPGADWVKLEVLADSRTLLPDPVATLEATRVLVKESFQVLCYTSDDPVVARRLKEAGATSVMPAGSPIGSGQGVLNPNNIRIILEDLKGGDPAYPVIVDAGVGTASDVAIAMELGCDGVLLNTGIVGATDPLRMAHAMRLAVEAGRLAAAAGRIPKKLYATASSPTQGLIERS